MWFIWEVTRLGKGLGVPRLWEVKSGGCRWAGCLQPGFSCGRSCASEADEGPEWPPVTFCPYWRGGQRSTESSRVGDFSGAVGSSDLLSKRLVCRRGVQPPPAVLPERARPALPCSLRWGPLGWGWTACGARGWGSPGLLLCCPDNCCYCLLDFKASSCVLPPWGWL